MDKTEMVRMTLAMYVDACGLEAVAAWDENEENQKRADVAWSRYEGARLLVAEMLHISEHAVDDDMEYLMCEGTL